MILIYRTHNRSQTLRNALIVKLSVSRSGENREWSTNWKYNSRFFAIATIEVYVDHNWYIHKSTVTSFEALRR